MSCLVPGLVLKPFEPNLPTAGTAHTLMIAPVILRTCAEVNCNGCWNGGPSPSRHPKRRRMDGRERE